MDLDPVDNLLHQIRGLKPNSIIPLPLLWVFPLQRLLHVDAPPEISWLSGLDPVSVGFEQGLESRLPGPTDLGGLCDSLLESYVRSCLSAFATALATALFARSLDSISPPHPSPPASSLSTSSSEISLVAPVVESK